MDPVEIIDAMYKKGAMLNAKSEELESINESIALAEKSYNIALSGKMMEFKVDHGVSICEKLARGDPVVADLKLSLDKHIVIRDACKRVISNTLSQIDILRSDLSYQKEERRSIGSTQPC